MSLLLVIDTCDARCAAAVFRGAALLAERAEPMRRGHAERLFALIEAALRDSGENARALDAVAAATGPGGFTGGRIGVAAARGLAVGLGRPALGADWFAAMAFGAPGATLVALPGGGGDWAQRFENGRAAGPAAPLLENDPRRRDARLIDAAERDAAGLAPIARVALAALAAGASPRPVPLYLRPPDAVAAPAAAAATLA